MAKTKAASRRKLGFRVRIAYMIGATVAGLWLLYYVPKIHEGVIFGNMLDVDVPDSYDGLVLWYPDLILLGAGVFFVLELATAFRFSPAVFRYSEVFLTISILLFMAYGGFYFHSGFANWRIENFLENITGESQDVDAEWWHFVLFTIAAFLPLALLPGNQKWERRAVVGYYPIVFGFVVFVLEDWNALRLVFGGAILPFLLITLIPTWFIFKEYVKEMPLYRRLFALGRGGSARFGGVYSFIKYDFNRVLYNNELRKGPIYAGRTTAEKDPKIGRRHIGLDSDSMMLTVAAMGGGKSLYAAWNTLSLWKGGALILDPKGEHAEMTGKSRKKFGPVHYLAPWTDKFPRASYNPIEDIDLHHPNARGDLMKIVQACIPQEVGETANAKHFRENTQRIMLGIMAHVLSEFDREYHNLPSIYDTILTGHPDGGAADPKAFDDLLKAMAINEAFGRAPMDAAKLLSSAGDSERGGFITTLANGLSWVNDEVIRPSIAKSSFSMRQLRTLKATVYLVIPFEHMSANARFLRLIVGAGLLACREPSKYSQRTLFLLDEFPQLGTFEPIKEGLVTLRSQKVKIWMMLQDIGQLKERYRNWQDFMSSCDKQFFAVNDYGTAETISKALGDYVDHGEVSRTRVVNRRPLRSPSEVQEDLRKGSKIQYVLPADGNPLRLKLVPAYKNFSAIKKNG